MTELRVTVFAIKIEEQNSFYDHRMYEKVHELQSQILKIIINAYILVLATCVYELSQLPVVPCGFLFFLLLI